MRIALIALPLALAACGRQPAGNDAAPAPAATQAASPEATPTGVAAVTPQPGELKTFGDWTVGCDNTKLCTMASLGAEGGEFPRVTMAVLRQPGPDGAFDLSFGTPGEEAGIVPVAATIDGRRLALATLNGAPAAAVARAMANGRTMTLATARDASAATISLAGASAALRYIDAQQGRAGTQSAAVATGTQPAGTVPAARPAPVIRAVAATGTAAQPDAAMIAAMRRRARCDEGGILQGEFARPEAHALGDGATLVMLPCSTGAYNLSQALFVVRGDRWQVAEADAPVGFDASAEGMDAVTSIVNGRWQDGVLTGLAKGRGLGDCGVSQSFVWDGTRLRLTEQAMMGECRGNPDYITTWRTQVVRR